MTGDTWFKMYANGCYWEADRYYDDLWAIGMGKMGFFLDPGIRIVPFDPMIGDETGGFPSGVPLRRKGSHPMKVFG